MSMPTTDAETWNWRDSLSAEERRELLEVDNLHGALSLALDWSLVFGAMALVAWAPNPLTIVLALFVIGARQLGFAILMHEAAHRTLFRNRSLNDWAGNWLAAYPIWAETGPYRRYHLLHHVHTETEQDPDLGLITPFPITRASFARKIFRVRIQQAPGKPLAAARPAAGVQAVHSAMGPFAAGGGSGTTAISATGGAVRQGGDGGASQPQQVQVKRTVPKVGRNDLCPCGSGKKYKHCHGQ